MSMIGLPNVRPLREMAKMKCENQKIKSILKEIERFKKTNVCKAFEKRKTQSLDSRGLELQTKVLKCKGLVEFY